MEDHSGQPQRLVTAWETLFGSREQGMIRLVGGLIAFLAIGGFVFALLTR